ncbi:decaprenyl-phosphate phosphoribosyltransferase [Buttiauxella sp. WJP83]|uniref:decaprenyl-phosphate phosphoribosyltransferase n=1 Tax=Buttiauxella sp. WJP83 TaxID=2986951 RepID=UPI0022DE0839|nr:decaprenyl-phosphate phosphoribosyltransferase [Buttiauxella sp. WJP83]WBM69116.1 decaprenyl-phosphate phosphoribosyltransferase [Buttiauxella sp. WJP83]
MNSKVLAHGKTKSFFWNLIKLLRPKHWIKNTFVLAPLIFSGQFNNYNSIANAFVAVILFCLGSSVVYIFNDIKDRERDRLHPKKSISRPIASGVISVKCALLLLMGLLFIIVSMGAFLNLKVLIVVLGYLALNVAYTLYLKHQPVMDIFTIAIGFVLRVYAGAVALSVPVSSWMFVTTLCLALYLAAIKRRQELNQNGVNGRQVLERYTLPLIERYAEISAICALIFYSLFVMSSHPDLVITVPLVLFGLFRYWYIVEMSDRGESPTDALLKDAPLLLTCLAWTMACIYVLWSIKH